MNIDKRLIRQTTTVRLLYILSLAAGITAAVLLVLQAGKISEIISRVFIDGYHLDQVSRPLQVLFIIIICRSMLVFFSQALASLAASKIMANLRNELLKQYLVLEPSDIQKNDSASHLNIILDGVDDLEAYFNQYLPQVVYSVSIPIVMLSFIFPVDTISALIFLVTAPLIPVFMVLIGKMGEKLTKRQWSALNRLSSHFLDTIQGLTTLKSLNQSMQQADRIAANSERYRNITMKVLRVTFLSAFVLEFIAMMSTAIIAVEVGLRLLYWEINFQDAFFLLLLAPEFFIPLRQLGLKFHAGLSGVTAANQIFTILEKPVQGHILAAITEIQRKRRNPVTRFDVRFRQVSYRYPERNYAALDDICFDIKEGQMVALVGESGSGKTTIARLLFKYLSPSGGEVWVDRQPLRDIDTDYWRESVGWVPQKPYLFHGTIAENIRVGKPDASDQEVIEAARVSNLHELICSLPDGYHTVIGENAMRISGGEAQRIALARVFIKDTKLVILDEPMANLDLENEYLLRTSLEKLYANRTILIIAHYLPTVMHADDILVLQNGRIVEQGNHERLKNNHGIYQRVVASHLA